MRVLVTGSFGNLGESTLLALFEKNYEIRCFDLRTNGSQKTQRRLEKRGVFDTIWGDILDIDAVRSSVEDIDCIIHLVGIMPPVSEKRPDLARAINVEGTRNIINAAESEGKMPKFIFAGSVSTFGPTMHLQPPRTAEDPLVATDTYTETKIACEGIVRACSLPWTILRITAAPPTTIGMEMSALMFEMPIDQRIEFVHSRDVGLACANAVEAETSGKTLLIGGGRPNQMIQREFVSRVMKLMGLGLPPESAFKVPKRPEEYYYTDWLDTEESQRLLKYQTRTFDQYLEEMKSMLGVRRYITRLLKGQAMKQILAASPYYTKSDD